MVYDAGGVAFIKCFCINIYFDIFVKVILIFCELDEFYEENCVCN